MKDASRVVELDLGDLSSKLDRIEEVMGSEAVQPFRQVLQWCDVVLGLLRDKAISLERLKRLLFGSSTEQTSRVVPPAPTSSDSSESGSAAPGRRRPGHGRNPAQAYRGCVQKMVTHQSLHPGDPCPHCGNGTLYRQSRWSPEVRLKGQVPVVGTVYHLERLRCHLCGKIETADLPEEAGPEKYDASVASVVAVLRYGEGLPWNRLQRLQQHAGIPLAASVQWQLVGNALPCGIQAAHDQLHCLAAQGELMHNDDTTMRVLELKQKLNSREPLLEEDPERRGVFTTGILSRADDRPPIALFFTGAHHSGENLRDLLAKRQGGLPPPIQMCDALSRNMPEELRVLVANCLVHGRRNFVDVVSAFPSEVRYVLECLKVVYKSDAEARKQGLSAEDRLRLHQQQSGPVMDELKRWLKQQFDEKKVEPNSSLGGAISYMQNHWEKLTLFLRVPGVPLDNNLCEQALKMAIRHRKNSLFYKTLNGAAVGDVYMSLIHTCYLSGADPFDYLTQLQRNHERVHAVPSEWMPWNYQEQLARAEQRPQSIGERSSHAEPLAAPIPDG